MRKSEQTEDWQEQQSATSHLHGNERHGYLGTRACIDLVLSLLIEDFLLCQNYSLSGLLLYYILKNNNKRPVIPK